jgi:DNA-binding NtrC family response regulator
VVYPANGGATGELGGVYRKARGTMFLKNIHALAPVEQEQLLAGLEQVSDPPDGAARAAGARLVSSATESVDSLVRRGELSAALYYKLSVYRIHLPSLRERRQDIPELFAHMVRRAANGGGAPRPAPPRLLENLMEYDWPGNLRELQNIARTYALTGQAEEIIATLSTYSRSPFAGSPAQGQGRSLKEQVKGASLKLESEIILRTLERHRWNRRRAAESLRISYRSLLYKMKNCNLRSEAQPQPEGKREL